MPYHTLYNPDNHLSAFLLKLGPFSESSDPGLSGEQPQMGRSLKIGAFISIYM